MLWRYGSPADVVAELSPRDPVVCIHPDRLREAAARMIDAFPGDVLYAVKCNDMAPVVRALHGAGVRHFDTASVNEVRMIRDTFPDAECHFMHPVKSREAIAEAYHQHGVRVFALDHGDELAKIMEATDHADDLMLVVRLAVDAGQAMLDLSGKFGASPREAARLLNRCRRTGARLGLTFHVGSQCERPEAFTRAIETAGRVARMAKVPLDVLDVGGGLPGGYDEEPRLRAYIEAINEGVRKAGFGPETRLQCEPGRALAAPGVTIISRVELRRDHALFINDGVFGRLSELKFLGPRFPMAVIRPGGRVGRRKASFRLYGPTCDSVDTMPGPFLLPADVKEGDWIAIDSMGAYSTALRTRFNGFDTDSLVVLRDQADPAAAEPPRLAAAAS